MADTANLLPLMFWRCYGIATHPELPEGVERATRLRGNESFLYLLNHTANEQLVPASRGQWRPDIGGSRFTDYVNQSLRYRDYGISRFSDTPCPIDVRNKETYNSIRLLDGNEERE